MTTTNPLAAGTWTFDPQHSEVSFSVRHAGISKVRGVFGQTEVALQVAEDVSASTVSARIQVASINTGNAGRDDHVRGADFFDAEAHPEMTFVSTSVQLDGGEIVLTGDLTIKGETRSVTLEGEFGGVAVDAFGVTRAGFSVETTISRKDFGITWSAALETGGVMVSDKVKIAIDAEFTAPEA